MGTEIIGPCDKCKRTHPLYFHSPPEECGWGYSHLCFRCRDMLLVAATKSVTASDINRGASPHKRRSAAPVLVLVAVMFAMLVLVALVSAIAAWILS